MPWLESLSLSALVTHFYPPVKGDGAVGPGSSPALPDVFPTPPLSASMGDRPPWTRDRGQEGSRGLAVLSISEQGTQRMGGAVGGKG